MIDDLLGSAYTLSEVKIVKHAPREFRSLQGRVEQSLDSLFHMIQTCLPVELRKDGEGTHSKLRAGMAR